MPISVLIVEANPAACALYARDHSDLIGTSVTALIHEDDHAALSEALQRAGRGGSSLTQAVGRRQDGRLFEVEIHCSPLPHTGAPHALYLLHDVSDRERSVRLLERRVQERTHELSTLLQVSRAVVSTLQLGPLLAQTLNRLKDVVDYEAAAIFSLDDEDALTLLDDRGPRAPESLPRRWDLSHADHLRMVLDHRRPLVIPDVRAATLQARAWQSSWGAQPGQLAEDGASWLGVPLLVKDQLIGTLTLEPTDAEHFTPLHAKEGLVPTLTRQCVAFNRRYDLAVTTAFDGEPAAPIEVKETLYRVAHEALYNTVKHAGASEVRAVLRITDSYVSLVVEDDGVGFAPPTNRIRGTLACTQCANASSDSVARSRSPAPSAQAPASAPPCPSQ